MIYQSLDSSEQLSQGDIIDGCPVFDAESVGGALDPQATPIRWLVRGFVITQACDLAQNKTQKVNIAIVQYAQDLVERSIIKASLIRDRVRRGQVYGWYFLPAAPEPIEMPESIVDLRDIHTVARPVLEQLIANGKRVCRLVTPYREHLAQHLSVTYSRIGLPEPYETQD